MGHGFTVYKGSESGKIIQSQTYRDDLTSDQVLVDITHSGLCGSDLHFAHGDMVLGHEGAGIVKAIGPSVKDLEVGDRVGWGWVHGSCGKCDQCLRGWTINCAESKQFGSATFDQGSLASQAVWPESALLPLPEGLTNAEAAPLMCAGVTVFDALYINNVRPTDRVGIVGIGGLGHLAIQFAAKMGCEVVVFSSTEDKREEAMNLGAHRFYVTKGVKELTIARPIDHLLTTTSQQPDFNLYIPVMAPRGHIYPLTVSFGEISVPHMPMLMKALKLNYSTGAPMYVHRKMLDFAALHQIKPIIEKFPLSVDGITDAFEKLNNGHMRYRAVLYQS